jgi:hypothetical protein
MEDRGQAHIMAKWQTRADSNRFSDAPTDEIPVVKDQLRKPVRAPAEAYWEPAPAPRGRWAQVLAKVRPFARLFVVVPIYLGLVLAASLIVARIAHTPIKGPSAAGTGHQQEQNGLVLHRPAQHQRQAARKPPAIRPGSTIFPPPPPLSLFTPSPAPSQPLPGRPTSSPPSPSPTSPPPTPTSPPPTPTSPPPTPTSPPPTPISPPPTPTDVPTPTPT